MIPVLPILALVTSQLWTPPMPTLASVEARGATLSFELDRIPLPHEETRFAVIVETRSPRGEVSFVRVPVAGGLRRYDASVPHGEHVVHLVTATDILQTVVVKPWLEPLGRYHGAPSSPFFFGARSY